MIRFIRCICSIRVQNASISLSPLFEMDLHNHVDGFADRENKIGRMIAETIVVIVGASIAAKTDDAELEYAIRKFLMSFIVVPSIFQCDLAI